MEMVANALFESQPWVIPTGTAILGLIAGWLLKSHERNTALALANVQTIREKTEQMLRAVGTLGEYFEPFAADPGNEFADQAEPEDWAPLHATSLFIREVAPLTVWLGQRTQAAVWTVIERSCFCFAPALHLAGGGQPTIDRDETVRNLSRNVLEAIEDVYPTVQADLGLERTFKMVRKAAPHQGP
jgi:hypothetical protein